MIKSNKATSIVEVMIIMLIVIVGTVGMYTIFGRGQALSNTTTNRIQAIQIAREGLEAMINIRDTNYLLFSANYKDCWNTLNYNGSCVTDINGFSTDITAGSYKIYPGSGFRWNILKGINNNYSDNTYKNFFKVGLDSNGLYTQSGGTDIRPVFTRELKIDYIDTNGDSLNNSNDEKIKLTSLVQWSDSSKKGVLKVELSTLITNFKNK